MEFYRADDQPIRTQLASGRTGYIIVMTRAWKPWRRWFPIPVRKTVGERWPVKVGETRAEGDTYSVTFGVTGEPANEEEGFSHG